MAVYNASKFAAVGLSAAVREEYRDSGVSVTTVLPSAVRTRLASGVPLGRGLPTVEPEAVARAIVDSVASRRAEVTVPRYLAGWDLLDAATPDALMGLARRVIRRPSGADIGRARRARRLREGDRSAGKGATMRREPRIVIIGAGVAGIATAVTLQRAGFHDFTILEKGADVGGVWHWNRYPGLTCDVPSQLYQFSFAPKPDWTGIFAPGDEIQRYLRGVVEQFGLDDRIRLKSEVVSTVFDGATWQVATADGTELEADFVIAATGVLHHPFTPDIPGLDSFDGDVVHTARWDDDIVTSGRRIAVIGNGSTGVQIVSALQRDAAPHHALRAYPAMGDLGADGPASTDRVGNDPAQIAGIASSVVRRPAKGLAHLDRYRHAADVAAPAGAELRTMVSAPSDSRSRTTRPPYSGLPTVL